MTKIGISTNVLKPFEISGGSNMQELSDAVTWLEQRTKRCTVDAMDVRILSLDTIQKKDDAKYTVHFLSIDTMYPYIKKEKNLLQFSEKNLCVGKSVLDMMTDSGLIFEIDQKLYIVDATTIPALGNILDCHGKMLNRSSLARDLCICEALSDMDEINFVYRENKEDGIKSIVSVFGNRFQYRGLDECLEECLHILPKVNEMWLHKWVLNNTTLYVYLEYPNRSIRVEEDEWHFGICAKITNLYGSSESYQWYARYNDKYVVIKNKNISHHAKALADKKSYIREEFFKPYSDFSKRLESILDVVELRSAIQKYRMRNRDLFDEILKKTNIHKAIGNRRYQSFKENIITDISFESDMGIYNLYKIILEKGLPFHDELNDRYKLMYLQSMGELDHVLKSELYSFIKKEKNNCQIEGQISLFDGKVSYG